MLSRNIAHVLDVRLARVGWRFVAPVDLVDVGPLGDDLQPAAAHRQVPLRAADHVLEAAFVDGRSGEDDAHARGELDHHQGRVRHVTRRARWLAVGSGLESARHMSAPMQLTDFGNSLMFIASISGWRRCGHRSPMMPVP